MTTTRNSSNLFSRIRDTVARIPKGYVSTYGSIAALVGIKDARKVGWALHNNQDPKIPCHRVVFANGQLAPNFSLGGWQEQKLRLQQEGINFKNDNRVNLELHLWQGD